MCCLMYRLCSLTDYQTDAAVQWCGEGRHGGQTNHTRALCCRYAVEAGHSEEAFPWLFTADVVFTLAHLRANPQRKRETARERERISIFYILLTNWGVHDVPRWDFCWGFSVNTQNRAVFKGTADPKTKVKTHFSLCGVSVILFVFKLSREAFPSHLCPICVTSTVSMLGRWAFWEDRSVDAVTLRIAPFSSRLEWLHLLLQFIGFDVTADIWR